MSQHISFPVKRICWSQYEHETPILLQEANGPCPLIALVNTLLLQNDVHKLEAELNPKSNSNNVDSKHIESVAKVRLLLNRNLDLRVALSEVLACLGDVLLDIYRDEDSSVVNKLLESLPLLHTGLSVDPNLYEGGFAQGDLGQQMFEAFGLVFVHGWLWDPSENVHEEHFRKLATFDRIQDFLLNPKEDPVVKADLHQWLDRHSTQLTAHGLKVLDARLEAGSLAVFFRNNHFLTIYKAHEHDFYLLITDSSLASNKCVWQSIISVLGKDDLFFTGDFVPLLENSELVPFVLHEDLELVRQLQEEEDAAMAQRMQKRYDDRQPKTLPKELEKPKEKKGKRLEGVPKKGKLLCVIT